MTDGPQRFDVQAKPVKGSDDKAPGGKLVPERWMLLQATRRLDHLAPS
jgi:hypothetical protein